MAEARGFEPPKLFTLTRFRVVRLQPLGHASAVNYISFSEKLKFDDFYQFVHKIFR